MCTFASKIVKNVMKISSFISLMVTLMVTTLCYGQPLEKGVSKELAENRVANISNVNYQLTFNIPADRQKKVTGTATITFTLQQRADVVLDFQGKFSGLCQINKKKKVPARTENEHIVLPMKPMKVGVNTVTLSFESTDDALNRNDDYMYTLFVPDHARSCFPCFDQPDIRATYEVKLNAPEGWKTMASNGVLPIPTYLFSFVAGNFQEKTKKLDGQLAGHSIRALYRETAPENVEQLDKVFEEAEQSLKWMESYTYIKCPFKEYGLVILPGYQFGGMEHPGAIQLNDRRVFLGKNPTQEDELSRAELIAHETAHLWFGDMVSLKWFEDVWAKEVFANFMASKITRRQYTKVDHELNFLKTYQARAIAIDRTEGTHPIAQPLENLNHASLLYDNIIYDKAPVMMRMLEDLMGPKAMQTGLQKYIKKFYFKNASWDDLITILDAEAPEVGVRQFSEVWVKQKGMPNIHTSYQDGNLIVTQTDPYERGLCWRQKFEVRLIYDLDDSRTITIDMQQPTVSIKLNNKPSYIIPNYDGKGYGRFTLDPEYAQKLPLRLITTRNAQYRYALLLTLYDNYLMSQIPASYFGELYRNMLKETNPLIISTSIDHMFRIAFDRMTDSERKTLEQCITDLLPENKTPECRQHIIRKMAANATAPEVLNQLYAIWESHSDQLFNERDYMEMAYRLAIMRPEQWKEILDTQRSRLTTDDLRKEFDYVSRACNPDVAAQETLFRSLLNKENRQQEPWALHALRLLNADVREHQSNSYIPISLNELQTIQQNSDIFFPGNWMKALLDSHKSEEARQQVEQFLKQNPGYTPSLRNKILEAAWPLMNPRHDPPSATKPKVVATPKTKVATKSKSKK